MTIENCDIWTGPLPEAAGSRRKPPEAAGSRRKPPEAAGGRDLWSGLLGRATTKLIRQLFGQEGLLKQRHQCEPGFAIARRRTADAFGCDFKIGEMLEIFLSLLETRRTGTGMDHFLFDARPDGGFNAESQFSSAARLRSSLESAIPALLASLNETCQTGF